MKNRHSWILKKALALLTALLMTLSVLPAAVAVSPDWSEMVITVSWVDAETGEYRSVDAMPVTDAEGSFWITLPPEAPHEGLTISVVHPAHIYQYDTVLPEGITDAGEYLDGISYTPFMVTDSETGAMDMFCLYFSTVTAQPIIATPEEPGEDPEEAARKAAEEEAARIAAEEEAARIAAEEEAARITAEEEAARKAAEEEAARKAAGEEAARIAAEEEAARKAAEEEAARKAAEEEAARIAAEEEAARKAAEEEAARKAAEEEAARIAAEEEAARKAAEEEAAQKAAEEEAARIAAEEAARKAAEEEAARIAAEEEAARKAAEEEAARKAAEEEAARKASEEEAARKAAEEEAARKAAEEEAARKAAEEEAARKAAEEEAARKAAEEATDVPTDAPVMPVDELINRYGVTNAKVNFRKSPSTEAGKYGELPVGTYVYMIYTEKAADGNLWTLVDAVGERGYLMSEYISVLTQEDSDAYNFAQAEPAPVYTIEEIFPAAETVTEGTEQAEPVVTETEVSTETADQNEPENADTPTPEPTATAAPTDAPVITEGEMINRYGLTNAGKLALRQQPEPDGKVITRLAKGDQVYLLRADFNDAGDSWTYVEVNGQRGYIKTEYLNLLTAEDSAALNPDASPAPVYTEEEVFPTEPPTEAPTATEAPTETPTATPSPTPVPTDTPAPEIPVGEMINRYGKTNSKVFFRKEASTNSKSQGELKKNTSVYLIYTQENELGETWTYAMVNGKTGYIMTTYLDLLTEEDSAALEAKAKVTTVPTFTLEDIFPTAVPTEVVTIEATEEPTVAPTDTPTPKPTDTPTPTPTEKPTEAPTEAPTEEPTEPPAPTEPPTKAPTEPPTEAPTEVPTQAPTDTPVAAPTEEPYQRVGYAMTIGDGVPVREWPTASSTISDTLPANKVVYVTGQYYQSGVAWSVAEYDGEWGYIRADLLRMIPDDEMWAYIGTVSQNTTTPSPDVTVVPYVYDADEMSCYGYVTTDAVNFRAEPSSSSRRIRLMKKYALFIVYGTVEADGETWYKVSYNNQEGYLNGRYFKQMTVGEAEEFLASPKYQEGIANNSDTTTTTTSSSDKPTTTGSPTGVVSAEDQKVSEWVNPATGSTVSYEPFDPFATPEPLTENELEKNEFINSLISQLQSGEMKQEDLQTELEKFYKDAADPEGSVSAAMAYIQEKLGLETETPTEEPAEQVTEEVPEYPQEQSSGGAAGWIIALVLLAAAGGGGYYWYIRTQQKREAAQRIAKQKVAKQQKAMAGKDGISKPSDPVSAQNAAKVRTGSYTGGPGKTKPKATPSASAGAQASKTYRTGSKNPYSRYSVSDTDEDASYTASFKPNAERDEAVRETKKPDEDKPEA